MSLPAKHHYLPKFYLNRWTRGGKLIRFTRPCGIESEIDMKSKSPSAVAYQKNLYKLTDTENSKDSQFVEMQILQKIDDKAAIAFQNLDDNSSESKADKAAIARFMLSLLHRSPSRLKSLRHKLSLSTKNTPYESLEGEEQEKVLYSNTNRLLVELVNSNNGMEIISSFKLFTINTEGASLKLITSDLPVTVSSDFISENSFMMMPHSPDKIIILTHKEEVIKSFASQEKDVLVRGINMAIIEQSKELIIACSSKPKRLVERLFLRTQSNTKFDSIGLIRRNAPLIDFTHLNYNVSRSDKNSMKYK